MLNEQTADTVERCGFVALVGRPNVGKSTLLNRILGHRLSITSRKPQTTRHRILGVRNGPGWQALYADTPGLHSGGPGRMNKVMNRTVLSTMADVDLVLWVLEGVRNTGEDKQVQEQLARLNCPRIAVLNKVDKLESREKLLPRLAELGELGFLDAMVPVSALDGHNIDALEAEVAKFLPEGPALFPEDMLTDRSERFLASEMIREQIVRGYGDEVPYQTAVSIDRFELRGEVLHIDATIYVERDSQKKILLGSRGLRMRDISTSARQTLEQFFGYQVMLRNWVRVSRSWSDNARMLRQLGMDDE